MAENERKPGRPRKVSGDTEDKALDLGMLPALLGYNIRLAQMAIWRDFQRSVSNGDLRPGLFSLLVLASHNPGVAQIQLARQLAIDKASVVALIDRLERAGLITRRRSPIDRRRQGIFLTPDGNKRLRLLKREMGLHEKRFIDRMSEAEYQTLLTLLRRLQD